MEKTKTERTTKIEGEDSKDEPKQSSYHYTTSFHELFGTRTTSDSQRPTLTD